MVGIKSVSETIRKTTLLTEWRLIKNFKENARTLRERTCCTAAEKERRNPGGIPKSSALLRKFNQLSNFSIWLNRLAIVFSVFQKPKKGMLQNSTFVGLALPLFLITFFSYLVWLQFFPLLKPVNYSSSRWFLECFRR